MQFTYQRTTTMRGLNIDSRPYPTSAKCHPNTASRIRKSEWQVSWNSHLLCFALPPRICKAVGRRLCLASRPGWERARHLVVVLFYIDSWGPALKQLYDQWGLFNKTSEFCQYWGSFSAQNTGARIIQSPELKSEARYIRSMIHKGIRTRPFDIFGDEY